jgi:serine/threonine-protein kinase HipA
MARRPIHTPLSVFLSGSHVGTLRRAPSGAVSFQYSAGWLNDPQAIPVSLSLPLRESRYSGEPVNAVFDNLLPDSEDIRRRVAERVGAGGTDAYSLLSSIGRDCVGALQFLSGDKYPDTLGAVQGEPIDPEGIAALLDNLATAPLGLGDDNAFRISLAGAQEKTALLWHHDRWNKPIGTTATTHILKPSIGRLPNGMDLTYSVENEFLCLKLLTALGLPAAKADITDFADRRVLVVERFDRKWTQDGRLFRLPQEDCCQALGVPPTRKYQSEGGPGLRNILELMSGSDEPERDQRIIMKAAMAFWLLGATDGHAKNFSLMLGTGGRFHLAPLYDVLTVQPIFDAGGIRRTEMKLAMSAGDNRHYRIDEIRLRHFIQTAARANVGRSVVESCFAELADSMSDAMASVASLDMPAPLIESLDRAIRARIATAVG